MAETPNVYQRLLEVQKAARAPREVKGRFGNARSAEQILEALKPVCNEHGLFLSTSDTMELIGDRHYVIAVATVVNVDKPEETVHASAYAWENEVGGGLDTSQVTGKTSSYAKKYALQNLFAIDDTKDADQDEAPTPARKQAPVDTSPSPTGAPTEEQQERIIELGEALSFRPKVLEARMNLIKTSKEANDFILKLEGELKHQESEADHA